MKKNLSALFMALSLVVISGCKHGLTIEDLTRAQGICWWDVDVSQYAHDSASFGIAYRDEGGKIIPTRGLSVFSTVEAGYPNKVRIIVWDYFEPMIEYAVLWEGGSVHSSITNKFDTFYSPWNTGINTGSSGSIVQLGEPLLSGCMKSEDRTQKKLHLIMQANLDRKIESEQPLSPIE